MGGPCLAFPHVRGLGVDRLTRDATAVATHKAPPAPLDPTTTAARVAGIELKGTHCAPGPSVPGVPRDPTSRQ